MNIIDTRELHQRLKELEALEAVFNDAKEAFDEARQDPSLEDSDLEDLQDALNDAREDFHNDEMEELNELRTLEAEIPEWKYGEAMIPINEFTEYVEQLCEDCGYISRDFPHWIVVDWEATAENVAMDYTQVTYQNEDYYARS